MNKKINLKDKTEMIKYFSQWFNIIPFLDVRQLYNDGDRSILLLLNDGTDRYIDGYTMEELEQEYSNGCIFGLDKGRNKK